MTALILPFVNIERMNIFLDHVSRDFKDYFFIMIVDQAAWHTSKRLKIPENIRLIAQTTHSPELYPVEHVWEEIREKAMPNAAFKSLDDVERGQMASRLNIWKTSHSRTTRSESVLEDTRKPLEAGP